MGREAQEVISSQSSTGRRQYATRLGLMAEPARYTFNLQHIHPLQSPGEQSKQERHRNLNRNINKSNFWKRVWEAKAKQERTNVTRKQCQVEVKTENFTNTYRDGFQCHLLLATLGLILSKTTESWKPNLAISQRTWGRKGRLWTVWNDLANFKLIRYFWGLTLSLAVGPRSSTRMDNLSWQRWHSQLICLILN